MTFDDVLPSVARVCETSPGFDQIARCGLVRDLRGHVRIVIERGMTGGAFDAEALAAALTAELGPWFVEPIFTTDSAKERGRLARAMFGQARPWSPSWRDAATGEVVHGRAGVWSILERRISKEEWLSSAGSDCDPPWPLREKTPGIATFYSFKGGVGRTTSLVSCAWQLARQGKRVVVLDLDLEAPGLGSLLDAETDRGVLDFVVDHLATGSTSLHGAHGPARALGADAERVTVLPAGRLGVSFLEKLGRLDFAGSDPWKVEHRSPVEQALEALLEAARREFKPDYILIDSRAGLHDLAGLSLHRLAHVDVLVGRASGQGYDGLDLTIEALAARKGAARMRTVILHTMTPEDQTSAEGVAEIKAFRERAWRAFDRHVYQPNSVAIGEETADAHHIPIAVPFDSALTRFRTVGGVERAFFGPGYAQLLVRIETLCAPEDFA